MLPVPYFQVVFTLPTLTGEIAFQNTVYDPVPHGRRDAHHHRRRPQASRCEIGEGSGGTVDETGVRARAPQEEAGSISSATRRSCRGHDRRHRA
ncbi:hypothetical protein BST63_00485 [Bradyrhizobium canariense]|uniref:Uncharacterized protein n=1 Tax=Bradyrhizobium canariense TaxID=255045 RepID=A0ABX3XBG4_9BRAD|nr:hypothetical protein BSR47_00375 [Bradyrhizobium canariense]OSJ36629.1 hypothetical protein BST63_00485 [Bradyrhizobium canariense]